MGCRLWGRTESDTTERLSSSSSNRLTDLENELIGVGGRMGVKERIVREFGIDMYTLLYLRWITNKDLLYRTGNSAQCYVASWMGGEFGGEWIHICVWVSPFDVTFTTLLIGYIQIQNKKLKKI